MFVQVEPPFVLTCHWYVAAPVDAIVKEVFVPAQMVDGAGCVPIAGAVVHPAD